MVKIFMIDAGLGKSSNTFPNVVDVADLNTFLATYSGCGVLGAETVTPQSITPTAPQADSNVDRKLKVYFKDADAMKRGMFVIAAPSMSGTIGKRGERLTLAQCQTQIDAWKTGNGSDANMIPIRGTFVQRV